MTAREIPLTLGQYLALPTPTTVSRDGVALTTQPSEDAAYFWLQRHQGQSASYALQYGGYTIAPATPPMHGPEPRTPGNRDGNPQHDHLAAWCPACEWATASDTAPRKGWGI